MMRRWGRLKAERFQLRERDGGRGERRDLFIEAVSVIGKGHFFLWEACGAGPRDREGIKFGRDEGNDGTRETRGQRGQR
jgi:hypothetical protein